MSANFDFKAWASEAKLSSVTIKKMEEADLTEPTALQCVTAEMLKDLEVTIGQYALLCKATAKLQVTTPAKAALQKVTLEDLKADQALNALLAEVDDTAEVIKDDDQSFYLTSPTSKPGEKPLLIPDFVDSYTQPESDHEIARDGQTAIILRTSKTKPKLESIKVPAWSAANAKIMDALIKDNKLKTRQDISDYLSYTVKVSELFEVFDCASVMLYDNQYRVIQHRNEFRWGKDSEHLHSRFLRSKPAYAPPARPQQRRPAAARAKTTDGQEICVNYQNQTGCRRATCNYAIGPVMEKADQHAIFTSHRGRSQAKRYETMGQMMPKTRRVLNDFYRPYNERLAALLNDTDFLWL
ncbi:Carbohydrate sulfotransferase 15 [Branchiostoma belcheri]|nr:Carbohydrate sulfotransferase 15 [Branchiostoma belcheri]